MPNSFYNHATYPAPNSAGSSSSMRAELDLITAGFNKLPTLAGNGYKVVGINPAGDALIADPKLMNVDFSTTNTAGGAVGRLTWNDTDGTLDLGLKGGNVTLQLGQEQNVRIYNETAVGFVDMQVVRITGSSGTRLTADLAQANSEATSASTLAIMTEPCASHGEGFATTFGLIRQVDTSAFAEGATLYLSTTVAGGVTTTKPQAPNHTVILGWCVRSHATQGVIYVNISNGHELDELHDVLITSVSAYNMLRRNAANTVWENIAGPSGAIVGTTDTQTLTNKTISGGTVTGAVVTGLATPSANSDAATKAYVDSLVQGLDAKASARVATTANITLSGTQTIDGVSVIAGDRVLVKDQSSPAQNGIYLVAAGAWTRTTDADTWDELVSAFVFVESGTANANNGYTCTIASGGTLGTTAVTWTQFSGAGQITAGDGLTKTGNTLNVVTASSARIVVNANDIDLALTGVSAGTYKSVTVDTYGRVTNGTNPTTLAGYGITDAYTKTYIDTLFGSTASAAASAAAALVSQNAAATSASNASTSETNALSYKNAAQTSATNAATSETNAAASAASAAASYDSFDDRYLGPKATAPAVDNDGNPLLVGALYFDTTINSMRVYDGSLWMSAGSSVNGTSRRYRYIATAGQTTFTGVDSNGATLAYDPLYLDIYLNGSRLDRTDYTATSGSSIVLSVAASLNDELNIVCFGTFAVATHVLKSGDTMSGQLTLQNNLAFTGTGNRITGDFSNATIANRVMFQTSTANGTTNVGLVSNGTGTASVIDIHNASDPTNASKARMSVDGTAVYFASAINGTGTYLPMTFYTGGSERVRVDTSGNVGIGTSSPVSTSKATIQYEAGGGLTSAAAFVAYGGSPTLGFRQASGTLASPGASNTSVINLIGASTSDGTNFFNTVAIQGNMESTATTGSHPTFIAFATTPSGATSRAERMRIESSGNVLVTGAGGLGYGTGSGGTANQATSRTTAVTVDKPTGAITLFSAAGTASTTIFQLLNNKIAATDTVVVSVKTSTNVYRAYVVAVTASACQIAFESVSGTAVDAPVFNFAVIKGATA